MRMCVAANVCSTAEWDTEKGGIHAKVMVGRLETREPGESGLETSVLLKPSERVHVCKRCDVCWLLCYYYYYCYYFCASCFRISCFDVVVNCRHCRFVPSVVYIRNAKHTVHIVSPCYMYQTAPLNMMSVCLVTADLPSVSSRASIVTPTAY